MPLRRCEECQKAATAGSKQLAPYSARTFRRSVPIVDRPIAHSGMDLSFEPPTLVEYCAYGLDMARIQLRTQIISEFRHTTQQILSGPVRFCLCALFRKDGRCGSRFPRVKGNQLRLELLQFTAGTQDRLDDDLLVSLKTNEVEATERRRILVLLADALSAKIDFHLAAFFSQVTGRDITRLVGMQGQQQTNR